MSTPISVPPPDGIRIESGDNVSKPLDSFNPTVFQITCKKLDSFVMGGVLAQERITKVMNPATKQQITSDGSWVPVPGVKAVAIFAYLDMGGLATRRDIRPPPMCLPSPGS